MGANPCEPALRFVGRAVRLPDRIPAREHATVPIPVIISGSAHPELTKSICDNLELRPGKILSLPFKDGERFIKIEENVRGRGVFVVQPTCNPANEYVMELLLIIDALKRASARSITAVIPYFEIGRAHV